MGMRVTSSILFRSALLDINRVRQKLAQTQERAASGLVINRPSDDPAGMRAVTLLRSELDSVEQYQRNISKLRGKVAGSENAIGNATNIMSRARELAIQGANGTLDAASRQLLAVEVEALHGELLREANSQVSGSYLFAGYASNTQPFVASGPFVDGMPSPTVAFAGDSNEIQVAIGDGVSATVSLDGRRVFMGDADGDAAVDAGREDLFDILADLRDALANDQPSQVVAVVDRIHTATNQISVERTRIGTVQAQMEQQEASLAQQSERLLNRLSEVQDADLAEVLSDLVTQEAALQASLSATTRLIQPSLLDFLG